MDDADKSDSGIQNVIQDGIDQARRAPMLLPKGSCWFCEEPLSGDLRFCNKDCCSDFEAEEEAFKRLGR